jgi:hypothetical protein
MHQRTQRILGRWLFLALCIVPTVAVAAWAVSVNRPGYRKAWETELSDRLGLSVAVERVLHPRPGATVLEDVRIRDPETLERIAVIRLIETVQGHDTLAVAFSQPQVEPAHWGTLWRVLQRQITQAGWLAGQDVQLATSELTCGDGAAAVTLTAVRGRIESKPAGRTATLEFRIAGQEMPRPAQARLTRTKHDGEPFTRIEFHTGGNELPCGLLASYLPWLEPLGTGCRFNGSCSAAQRKAGWEGAVLGTMTGVDLDRLVGAAFPHKLSGLADVEFRELSFQGDRIRSAEGTVSAGSGVISRSLVFAAADAGLAEEGEAARELTEDFVAYQQLAFTFQLAEDGLKVLGACDLDTPGTILTRDGKALLVQPREQPLPAVALVRGLVPDSRVQVPATRETDLLLRVLPIPGVEPPPGGRSTYPRIRFAGEADTEQR